MSKVLSFRVSDEEAAWAGEYCKARKLSRQDFLAAGFRSYRDDCARGVPEVPATSRVEAVKEQVAPSRPVSRVETAYDWAMDRQRKLNEAKYRSRS